MIRGKYVVDNIIGTNVLLQQTLVKHRWNRLH